MQKLDTIALKFTGISKYDKLVKKTHDWPQGLSPKLTLRIKFIKEAAKKDALQHE